MGMIEIKNEGAGDQTTLIRIVSGERGAGRIADDTMQDARYCNEGVLVREAQVTIRRPSTFTLSIRLFLDSGYCLNPGDALWSVMLFDVV